MAEIYGDKSGAKGSHRNWALFGVLVAIALLIIIALVQRYG